jgi:thiol-disulfide isomerase/thioredoxin
MARLLLATLVLAACSRSTPSSGGLVEIIAAPAMGNAATFIAEELARGGRDGVPVLVYVGATWCEPCRDFHEAAAAGALDGTLGPLRFLEFDLDRDGERLAAAGYHSDLVPLFAQPAADGKPSGRQTDGVKKGGNYVEQLAPRIRALVKP